jgi:hypothetical protein
MGTLCHFDTTVANVKNQYLAGMTFRGKHSEYFVIAHNRTWALQGSCNLDNGVFEVMPVFLNIYRKGDAVCEKVMDASVHPYRYDCPKSYLEMTEKYYPVCGPYIDEWLAKAKANSPIAKKIKVEYGKYYELTNGSVAHIIGEYNRACYLGYIGGNRYRIKKSMVKALADSQV